MKTLLLEGRNSSKELDECEIKTGTAMLNEAVPVLGEGGKRMFKPLAKAGSGRKEMESSPSRSMLGAKVPSPSTLTARPEF